MVTLVKVEELEKLLIQTNYCPLKTKYLVEGFHNGFDIGYRGREDVQLKSLNLKLEPGQKGVLWNKVMKEVEAKQYAGLSRGSLMIISSSHP